jgi:hypothetical protein
VVTGFAALPGTETPRPATISAIPIDVASVHRPQLPLPRRSPIRRLPVIARERIHECVPASCEDRPVLQRPERGECADYYFTYIDRVPPNTDVLDALVAEPALTLALFAGIAPGDETFRYAAGKWSIRELVGHMIDTERVMAFRALSAARRDPQPLPGMEPDDWVRESNADARPLSAMAAEFGALRSATVAMLTGFGASAWGRRGTSNGREFTVRTFPFIILGHELHHRAVLEERYLAAL